MKDMSKYLLQELSVAVIDNHAVVVEGLKSILHQSHVRQLDIYPTVHDLLPVLSTHLYDIYIFDVKTTDYDACTLIDDLRSYDAGARIVIHTMTHDVWQIRQLMEKHVNAIVFAPVFAEELPEAITTVMGGETYHSPVVKKAIQTELGQDRPSQREVDVIKEIAKGYTSKEIAEHLFISENTVEAHRKNLLFKLKARNIADLVVKAISRGYINPMEI